MLTCVNYSIYSIYFYTYVRCSVYHEIGHTLLPLSHERNTEEENNGYVVFKYPRIHWGTLVAVADRFLEVGCSLISSLDEGDRDYCHTPYTFSVQQASGLWKDISRRRELFFLNLGYLLHGLGRRKVRLIECNAKCRYLKNLPAKGLYTLYTCVRVFSIHTRKGKGGGGRRTNQREG